MSPEQQEEIEMWRARNRSQAPGGEAEKTARWRPLPPVAVLAGLIAMLGLRLALPDPTPVRPPWTWLGLAIALLGLAITFAAAAEFQRRRTNIQTFGEPTRLVTGGLFGLSRNPMYLGFALLLAGAAAALGGGWPSVIPVAFVVLARAWYIPFEERALHRAFGEEYDNYRRRVRRWL